MFNYRYSFCDYSYTEWNNYCGGSYSASCSGCRSCNPGNGTGNGSCTDCNNVQCGIQNLTGAIADILSGAVTTGISFIVGVSVGVGILVLVGIGIGVFFCIQCQNRKKAAGVQVPGYAMAPQPGYAYPAQYQYPNNGKSIIDIYLTTTMRCCIQHSRSSCSISDDRCCDLLPSCAWGGSPCCCGRQPDCGLPFTST